MESQTNGGLGQPTDEKNMELLTRQRDMYERRSETAYRELRKAHETIAKQREALAELRDEYTELSQLHYDVVHAASWKFTFPFRYLYSLLEKHVFSRVSARLKSVNKKEKSVHRDFWFNERKVEFKAPPLVSVIVPNYNHEPYLRERLESIYMQTYDNFEVILLDDCSTDNSRVILNEYAEMHADRTRVCFNGQNGGSVFSQWEKGLSMANGALIWIAESDDYCAPDFLEQLVPAFQYESVMIAFARSVFMQDGERIWSTEEYLEDLRDTMPWWDKPFTMSAHNAVQRGFARKNLIPNVSSAVFRNIRHLPVEMVREAEAMRLSGDWLFYLTIMRGGTLHYTNYTTNYYRVHKESTSLKTQVTSEYYTEYEQVSKYVARNYDVNDSVWEQNLAFLKKHYMAMQKTGPEEAEAVAQWYHVEDIKKEAAKRTPNIAMAAFDLQVGGGEMVPIHLANEMKRQNYAVTLLDFGMGKRNEKVRKLIDPAIPVVKLYDLSMVGRNLAQLGADIVHSHHGSVDACISASLTQYGNKDDGVTAVVDTGQLAKCKQVITLHGMYEAISQADLNPLLEKVAKTCPLFIYIADKNLVPFEGHPGFTPDRFVKLDNGLPRLAIEPVPRESMGIPEEAFVVCLASRGIPEKGWAEAVEIVTLANATSKRPIHLVLMGDGEMKTLLEGTAPEFVHFTGMVPNTRNYYAMADAGLFPTRFKGESYPLVVIEALMSGKPMLASDIAEVKNQLTTPDGELAGMVFPLDENWKVPVDEAAAMLVTMADDKKLYNKLCSRCEAAAEKFDIANVVQRHAEVYDRVRTL